MTIYEIKYKTLKYNIMTSITRKKLSRRSEVMMGSTPSRRQGMDFCLQT